MPEELMKLIVVLGISLVLIIIVVVPVLIWRFLKRKPLIPKGQRMESPKLFYIGIVVFGVLGIVAFLSGTPYFGAALFLMGLIYVVGLMAYKKEGPRGEREDQEDQ